MQSLIQKLDTIYDAEGMNAALTKNYDKPSVGMDGWSKQTHEATASFLNHKLFQRYCKFLKI